MDKITQPDTYMYIETTQNISLTDVQSIKLYMCTVAAVEQVIEGYLQYRIAWYYELL